MDFDDLSLLPQAAAQLRGALSNLYLALNLLTPPSAREENPDLDAKSALVYQSYFRLVRLVNSFSATRYLSGEPLPLQDRDIVDFVSELFAKAASLAPLRGLETRLICAADQHICAFCPEAIEQLLYQLLSNAFKYTPEGGLVTVEVKLSGNSVLLSVSDTGPGIPPERMEQLFKSYRQSGPPAPPSQGMGLGLALCQGIARGHGGSLTALSQPKGVRFVFSMPNRRCGDTLSDRTFDYGGGFNQALVAFSDSMPPEAFRVREL